MRPGFGLTDGSHFPNHFNIVLKRNSLVKDVMNGNILNLSFHITIVGIKLVGWHNLSNLIAFVTLGQSRDKFFWGHRDGLFQFAQCTLF